jgi:hypothetical protein
MGALESEREKAMKSCFRFVLAAALALAAQLAAQFAAAAPPAVIEGIQMPAWVERDGKRLPLTVAMELKPGDRLITGGEARVLIRLAEGSVVKLGENGTLMLTELEPRSDVFRLAMRVAEGAFRFTTDLLRRDRKRSVSIQVATVTAGIRGTDLWGKSSPDRQVVCLIEGAIEVGAEGEAPVVMDQPRQFYQRDKGKTAPIGFVAPEQLAKWAAETEIEAGKGAARRGGRWRVVLLEADTQDAALAVYDALREAGYAAEIRPAKAGERLTYMVRIGSLPSRAEAEALAARLRGRFGVAEPKVGG